MQHPETHTVTEDNGICPAGKPDECFWCHEALGGPHAGTCPAKIKTVVMRYSFEVTIRVPAGWDAERIEFNRGESSWCADNAIEEIGKRARAKHEGCLCDMFTSEYIREATDDDDLRFGLQNTSDVSVVG